MSNNKYSGGRVELETIYESLQVKESIANHYKTFSIREIDALLESDQELSDTDLEVIEELFGRTRAKLAGAGAKLGAQASNLKNRISTGVSNLGQKAGAYANNAANIGRQGVNALKGQYQTGDVQAGQIDPSTVGNQQAQLQDPNLAANHSAFQSILPELKKSISTTFDKIDADLNALGLDANALKQLSPTIAQAIRYAKSSLKKAYTEINKA